MFLPSPSTFSAQTTLSSHLVALSQDTTLVANAFILKYVTFPSVVTYTGSYDHSDVSCVSNVQNGCIVVFGLVAQLACWGSAAESGVTPASVNASSIATVFVESGGVALSASHWHATYLVYQKATGEAHDVFHVDLMDGASPPPASELEREAILTASRAGGVDEASLGAITIEPGEFKPGARYSVDLETLAPLEITGGKLP